MPLEITYQRPWLYEKQSDAIFDAHRFAIIEASTKSGKTAGCLAWLAEKAFTVGGMERNFWWVAPVYGQSKDAYRRMKQSLPRNIYRPNETELTLTLINGARIVFRSAEKPDCYDCQTEILTEQGWKLFSMLDRSERVMTLNPESLTCEWQRPDLYVAEDYEGPMLHLENRVVDMLVTPGHRFLLEHRSGRRRLGALPSANSHERIPARVGWRGHDAKAITHDHCRFMGIYLAEGHAAGCRGGTAAVKNGDYTVQITQSPGPKGGTKGDVRAEVKALLERLGYRPKENREGIYVRNKSLWQEFVGLGGSTQRRIPAAYKNLPPDKLRTLIHWMLLGDGSMEASGKSVYYTSSSGLADDMQEVCIKAGFGAAVRQKRLPREIVISGKRVQSIGPCYEVPILRSKFHYLQSSRRSFVREETYAGKIYCVGVPNHVVLVRRNGKACWSGNSLYGADVYAAVLDEASRMRGEAWEAVRSTITATGGPVRMIGNVHGRKNWFYRLARIAEAGDDPDMGYHRLTAYDAIDGGIFAREELDAAKRAYHNLGKDEVFEQLYMAQATDDGANPFGLEAIRACCEGVSGYSAEYPAAAGVDLAGRGAQNIEPRSTSPVDRDYSAIVILDRTGLATMIDRFRMPHTETAARIAKKVGSVPVLLDATGTGDAIVEALQRRGDMQALPYTFTERSRQDLLDHLALYIGEGDVHWPDEGMGALLRLELEAFEYVFTRRGVKWSVPSGVHDDLAFALALAVKRMPWRMKRALVPSGVEAPGGSKWTGNAVDGTAWARYQDSLKPTVVSGLVDESVAVPPLIQGPGAGKWK